MEAESFADELLAHFGTLGEAHLDAGDVVGGDALGGYFAGVGVDDVVGLVASAVYPLLLLLVPEAGLKGGTEAAETAKANAIAKLELFDDDFLEGDENCLDIDLGEGTLFYDAEDDVVGGDVAVERDGGIPTQGAVLGVTALDFVPIDHKAPLHLPPTGGRARSRWAGPARGGWAVVCR